MLAPSRRPPPPRPRRRSELPLAGVGGAHCDWGGARVKWSSRPFRRRPHLPERSSRRLSGRAAGGKVGGGTSLPRGSPGETVVSTLLLGTAGPGEPRVRDAGGRLAGERRGGFAGPCARLLRGGSPSRREVPGRCCPFRGVRVACACSGRDRALKGGCRADSRGPVRECPCAGASAGSRGAGDEADSQATTSQEPRPAASPRSRLRVWTCAGLGRQGCFLGDFGISMHPVLILWPHHGQGSGLASGHCLLSALLHGQVGLRPDGQHNRPWSCASRISSQHHGGLTGLWQQSLSCC
ncbi:uncharacterized protein LOC123950400 [Meles meles]|uniref:uncharacterized protein LOC123950400 n=1 Tax=Meles meles TaxID=9662 RepID=UPI001E69CA55|nr:uncharacterized protein LOC123950400 [Meles meles]